MCSERENEPGGPDEQHFGGTHARAAEAAWRRGPRRWALAARPCRVVDGFGVVVLDLDTSGWSVVRIECISAVTVGVQAREVPQTRDSNDRWPRPLTLSSEPSEPLRIRRLTAIGKICVQLAGFLAPFLVLRDIRLLAAWNQYPLPSLHVDTAARRPSPPGTDNDHVRHGADERHRSLLSTCQHRLGNVRPLSGQGGEELSQA